MKFSPYLKFPRHLPIPHKPRRLYRYCSLWGRDLVMHFVSPSFNIDLMWRLGQWKPGHLPTLSFPGSPGLSSLAILSPSAFGLGVSGGSAWGSSGQLENVRCRGREATEKLADCSSRHPPNCPMQHPHSSQCPPSWGLQGRNMSSGLTTAAPRGSGKVPYSLPPPASNPALPDRPAALKEALGAALPTGSLNFKSRVKIQVNEQF